MYAYLSQQTTPPSLTPRPNRRSRKPSSANISVASARVCRQHHRIGAMTAASAAAPTKVYYYYYRDFDYIVRAREFAWCVCVCRREGRQQIVYACARVCMFCEDAGSQPPLNFSTTATTAATQRGRRHCRTVSLNSIFSPHLRARTFKRRRTQTHTHARTQ